MTNLTDDFKDLLSEWKKVYVQGEDIDSRSDHDGADWESLCVGWCIAKGLSVEDSFKFYQKMIPLDLF